MELKHHLVGAGTFSTICSSISSIPIPAFAEAKTASLASSPMTSQSLYAHALDPQLVGQLVNDGQNFQIIVQG